MTQQNQRRRKRKAKGEARGDSSLPFRADTSALVHATNLRRVAYRFFGALFLYPDEMRLAKWILTAEALAQERDVQVAFPFFQSWQRLLARLQSLDESALGTLQEVYISLFMVHRDDPPCLPYESFYRDPYGQAAGWVAAQLEREYVAAGLALAPSLRDLPDHVAVELEFMAFLCDREAEAWEHGALADGMRSLKEEHSFLEEHLGAWFPAFAQRVRRAAPQSLYAVAVEAADAFVHHDRDWVRLLMKRIEGEMR